MPRPLQSLQLRQAIVAHLRADSGLIAVGAPPLDSDPSKIRIYGPRTPAKLSWPFVRVNLTLEGPIRLGTQVRVTVHTFSKARFEDECETLNAGVQASLEDATLSLSDGMKARFSWLSSQTMPDAAEADAWHGVNSFNATIG